MKEEYRSDKDIVLAATLMSLGFRLAGLDIQLEGRSGRSVGYFKFHRTPELDAAVELFHSGGTRVEPRAYQQNIRSLRARITSAEMAPVGN